MNSKNQQKKKEIDWMITLVPLALIVALCIVFFFAPEQSNQVLGQIRFLFGDTFGTYYLVIGLGIFFLSLFLAGSKYGNIVLGKPDEKPKYSFFAWGCMMFTCGAFLSRLKVEAKWYSKKTARRIQSNRSWLDLQNRAGRRHPSLLRGFPEQPDACRKITEKLYEYRFIIRRLRPAPVAAFQ